ncbi:hypothetical protein TU58_30265 [Bacillus cereus]|nr:hypothetical protein TU58_30265 [Bacillus cereus]
MVKLKTPLGKYRNSNPYTILNDLYPNLFSPEILKGYRPKKGHKKYKEELIVKICYRNLGF